MQSFNSQTITLNGQRVVATEFGWFAFITPHQPLLSDTAYTLSLTGGKDQAEQLLTPATFSFTTIGAQDHEHSTSQHKHHGAQGPGYVPGSPSNALAEGEMWEPDAKNPYENWRSNRPQTEWQKLPPLQAEAGATALSGQVLKLNGAPLAEVTMQIGGRATRTDSTGRFLLTGLTAGRKALLINGATASRSNKLFASFVNGVDIAEGQTNALPYTIWLPVVDTRHIIAVPALTKKETVLTTPLIPGLEIHIPKGVRLRTHDGSLLRELTITAIPANRTPMPVPEDTGLFFSPQAHGARVETADGKSSPGLRIIYPNVTGLAPGSVVALFDYEAMQGWYVYGEGTVSKDGKQVIPNEGVGLQQLKCTYHMTGPAAPATAPHTEGKTAGDPVDLSTGLFVYNQLDMVLPDTIPLALTRVYRNNDSVDRPFGKGATHPYDMYLWFNFWTSVDLVLPDGGKVRFDAITGGYEHTATPTAFYKATLTGSIVNGYDLKLKDGTNYHFLLKQVGGLGASHYMRAPLSFIEDRYGNRLVIERDTTADLRITRITTPNNRLLDFTYDGSSIRITQVKDNTGREVNYTYDGSGRLWKVTDPLGGITEYGYDASHRMTTIKDAKGITYLTNQYDANGRVTLQTQADSTTYQFAYTLDGAGKVTQTIVTDPRGNTRTVTFNTSGYSLTDTEGCCGGLSKTFVRQSGTNRVLSVTDALNRTTEYAYDTLGNVTSVTELAGTANAVSSSFTFNTAFNTLATVTDPLNHTTTFGYDSLGSLTSVTDALNHTSTFAYNAQGQMISSTNALNQTVQANYELGDLVSVTDPLGKVSKRFVDAAGRMLSATNALGQKIKYEYDALNRLTKVTTPLQGTTQFSYDANGNMLSVTDARNKSISYAYNSMERMTTRTDALTRTRNFIYDNNGNVSQVTDRKNQITNYSYDALDRLTLVTYHDGSTTSYTYDAASRVTQISDSVSGNLTYTYDDFNRLLSETTPQGTVSYTYDAIGKRTTMSASGQATVSYTYDAADRLTQITQGSATVSYTYDNADRVTSVTQPNGVVTEYGYDAASRLTALTYKKSGVTIGALTYEYDALGRRVKIGGSLAQTGLPSALTTTAYNDANHQTAFGSQTLTYDNNGNLTSDGTKSFTWNARNQLTAISGGGVTASFSYDALGRRTSKTIGSTTTGFLYDVENIVQEQSGGSAIANMLTGGIDRFFSRTDSSGTTSPLADALGSVVGLTDSSGAIQTQYSYEPFGKSSTSGTASSNSQKYTGREDDSTGLFYYRARYYSPDSQRFISEDPIGLAGGDENFYSYVHNNPTNLSDPSGLDGRKWLDFADGWRGGVDQIKYGDGFEIHLVNPQNNDVGICQGRQGWVGRHGFPDNVRPAGVPDVVISNLNGANIEQLRRIHVDGKPIIKKVGKQDISKGKYLFKGRTLFSFGGAVGMGFDIYFEAEAQQDLELRARQCNRTPAQQFYRDSEKAGHPEFYMTPMGPMPNPHGQGYLNRRGYTGPMVDS